MVDRLEMHLVKYWAFHLEMRLVMSRAMTKETLKEWNWDLRWETTWVHQLGSH